MISEILKEQIKRDYIDNGLSLGELSEKYQIKSKSYLSAYVIGKENMRSITESLILAHKKYPHKFLHSDETKQKMREKRLHYMLTNPSKTAWRMGNFSYLEQLFQKLLIENELDKKYLIIREYSVFPYYIDFAFIDLKIAVELDGSQHLLPARKESDEKKDKLLLDKGWRILRITENEIKHNYNKIYDTLIDFIGNTEKKYSKVGILKLSKKYNKVERDENGLSQKQKESAIKQRKVFERPSKEELFEMIKSNSFESIGKKYNVSSTTIRKWCKSYKIPYRKKDINH